MEEAERTSAKADGLPEPKAIQIVLRRRSRRRREGSLAAALAQSMALAVLGTAGAYPSWVQVSGNKTQIVLGAVWAIQQKNPAPDSPVLGPNGGSLMFAIAFCCLLSVLTGSFALTLDFLGPQQRRSWAPLLHCITAVLIACSTALGSCLFAVIRKRTHSETVLQLDHLSTKPGQGLFLAFLACVLAAAATGLSCISPALVEPARSSWDIRRPEEPLFLPKRLKTTESTVQPAHTLTDPEAGKEQNDCNTYFTAHQLDLSSTEGQPEDHVVRRRKQEAEKQGQEQLPEPQRENKSLPRKPESNVQQKARHPEPPASDLKPRAQKAHTETSRPTTSKT